jgi:two-component system sensor histidine kinase/response regulator
MWEALSTAPHCAMYGHPWMVVQYIIGNALVWGAYMAIPLAIMVVMVHRHMKFTKLAGLFAAFIMLCGMGHFWHLITVFDNSVAWYWWRGAWDVMTGLVSVVTATYCWKIIPALEAMPTLEEHRRLIENIKRVVPEGWIEYYQGR